MATSANQLTLDLSAASASIFNSKEVRKMIKELENSASPHSHQEPAFNAASPSIPVEPSQPAASETPAPPAESPKAEPTLPQFAQDALITCRLAYQQTMKIALEKGHPTYSAEKFANQAFLEQVPPPVDTDSITAFIACVSFAMLTEILYPVQGSKLLYAAQVASQANQARHAIQAGKNIANRNKSTPEIPK